jgi:hypothetical protein
VVLKVTEHLGYVTLTVHVMTTRVNVLVDLDGNSHIAKNQLAVQHVTLKMANANGLII